MSGTLQVDVAKNWRSLYKSSGAVTTAEIEAGAPYAVVLGPVDVPNGVDLAEVLDRTLVPVGSDILAIECSGFPEGACQVDIRIDDGSPATILDSAMELEKPGTIGGEPVEVSAVGADDTNTLPARTILSLCADTDSAGKSIRGLTAVVLLRVTA